MPGSKFKLLPGIIVLNRKKLYVNFGLTEPNKIILLSRKQYPTTNEASSLVVGYHAPNDRAEVSDLIAAIWAAYGIRIGVISFDTLLFLVVQSVLHGRTVSSEQLESLEGFANVTPK